MTLFPSRAACGLLSFLFLFFFASSPLAGQESERPAFLLEANISYLGSGVDQFYLFSTATGDNFQISLTSANRLAVGFGFRKVSANQWYSRYALMNLSSGESSFASIEGSFDGARVVLDGDKTTYSNLRLRYERGKYFPVSDRLRLGLGVMIDPVIGRGNTRSYVPEDFPVSHYSCGLDFGVVPQVSFALGERLRVAVEVPLPFVSVAYSSINADNPFVSEDNRRQSDFSVDLLRNVQAGLSLRFAL